MELSLKLAVVGSRRRNSFNDKKKLKHFIIKAREIYRDITLISGGCPTGADHFAEEIAEELNIPIIIHYPDKTLLPNNPSKYHFTKMYFARNTLIAESCEVLVALVSQDRIGGTEFSIKETEKLNKKVILL